MFERKLSIFGYRMRMKMWLNLNLLNLVSLQEVFSPPWSCCSLFVTEVCSYTNLPIRAMRKIVVCRICIVTLNWQFIWDTWSAFLDLAGKSLRVRFLSRVFQKDLSLSNGPLSPAQDKQAHTVCGWCLTQPESSSSNRYFMVGRQSLILCTT